jgi:hypothetical protein
MTWNVSWPCQELILWLSSPSFLCNAKKINMLYFLCFFSEGMKFWFSLHLLAVFSWIFSVITCGTVPKITGNLNVFWQFYILPVPEVFHCVNIRWVWYLLIQK